MPMPMGMDGMSGMGGDPSGMMSQLMAAMRGGGMGNMDPWMLMQMMSGGMQGMGGAGGMNGGGAAGGMAPLLAMMRANVGGTPSGGGPAPLSSIQAGRGAPMNMGSIIQRMMQYR